VVSFRDGLTPPDDDELASCTRQHVSGYKVPRVWVRVDHCERLPTGKPDYAWALRAAGG
jgi:hypothetical protein